MRMRMNWMWAALPLGAAALVQPACSSTEEALLQAVNGGCLINSDCEEDLICVFRRCHVQCETSADCPLDSRGDRLRCMLGTQPEHVCQLEDEKYCDYNSQCPEGQLCGADGECRDRCEGDRDCVSGQICVQGTCADPEEVQEQGQLPVTSPPDGQATGVPCAYDHQCLGVAPDGGAEFVCRDGACAFACFDDVDCSPNEICTPSDGDVTTPGACVPGNETGPFYCVPGEQVACDCLAGGQGIQVCDGDGTSFGPCYDGSSAGGGPPQGC